MFDYKVSGTMLNVYKQHNRTGAFTLWQ